MARRAIGSIFVSFDAKIIIPFFSFLLLFQFSLPFPPSFIRGEKKIIFLPRLIHAKTRFSAAYRTRDPRSINHIPQRFTNSLDARRLSTRQRLASPRPLSLTPWTEISSIPRETTFPRANVEFPSGRRKDTRSKVQVSIQRSTSVPISSPLKISTKWGAPVISDTSYFSKEIAHASGSDS